MPRSLQLGADAEAGATARSAATSPWKRAVRAGRPVAVSFSAGDSRSSDHQQHLVAFERQLDELVGGAEATSPALQHYQQFHQQMQQQKHQQQLQHQGDMELVMRGTLERTASTSSSIGGVSASGLGAACDARASARLSASGGSKITGRRHRTPRRFVITDIPDFDEFDHGTNGQATEQAAKTTTPPQPRVGKTEVKGRFTIIDLSPDSPMGSPRSMQLSPPPEPRISKPPVRHGLSPRRRVIRQSSSQNSVRSEMPTSLSNGSQQGIHLDPVDIAAKSRRVDLNVFDKQLEYLKKESTGMKNLLDGMVSTNARWISALNPTGAAAPRKDRMGAGVPRGVVAGPPAVLPVSSARSSGHEASMEEKLAAMQAAYMELQKKHDALADKNAQLEAQNVKLATLLEQQTQITDDLRVQLQQMSKYAENVVSDSEPSNESEMMSVFGDQSSVLEDQSPSGAEFTDYELRYELLKDALGRRRRRRYNVEEECMSDTSSEDSMSKSRSRIIDDVDNNYHFTDALLRSEQSAVLNPKTFELATNQADDFVFEPADAPLTLENMMDDQANQLSSSLHKQSAGSHGVEPMAAVDFADPVFSVGAQPTSNQVTHNAQTPDAMFSVLKRNDSLTSILLNNYSTVSSNSSIASVGVQVSALTNKMPGAFMSASGTQFERADTPTNQDGIATDKLASLSSEMLLFHDNQVLSKNGNDAPSDPLDDASLSSLGAAKIIMGATGANLLVPELDPQIGHQQQQQ